MRIITGRAKGLKLKTPPGNFTRPTGDRVKESLFGILSGLIDFSEVETVADIFAGTGALGLESVSRGAKSAIFIDTATTNLISENIRRARFESECKIFRGDFEQVLKKFSRNGKTFDLIFSDPPYHKGLAEKSLRLVAELNLLSGSGLMVVEHGADEFFDDLPENFFTVRKISYGKTTGVDIFGLKKENEK